MQLIHKLNFLRDRGKRSIIACGDFNVTPQEWEESGLLELLDCQIITTGLYETCRVVGNHIIDYTIVCTDLVPLINTACLLQTFHASLTMGYHLKSSPDLSSSQHSNRWNPPSYVTSFTIRDTPLNWNAAPNYGTFFLLKLDHLQPTLFINLCQLVQKWRHMQTTWKSHILQPYEPSNTHNSILQPKEHALYPMQMETKWHSATTINAKC